MELEADNRNTLLRKASLLFAERGYDAVSVSEIVEAAKVTKPTLYHYFGAKRGLLDALIAERGEPFLRAAKAGMGSAADVGLGLERISFALLQASRDDPVFARLRLSLSFGPPSSEACLAAGTFNLALREALEGFFREAEERHGNMRGRSKAYAASFLGTLDAYIASELRGDLSLGEAELRRILHQFMHGIFS